VLRIYLLLSLSFCGQVLYAKDCAIYQSAFDEALGSFIKKEITLPGLNERFVSQGLVDFKGKESKCFKEVLKHSKEKGHIDWFDALFINKFLAQELSPDVAALYNLKRNRELKIKTSLDAEILHDLNELYPQKISGVGKLDVKSYLYSMYSPESLEVMSDLLLETLKFNDMDNYHFVASKGFDEEEQKDALREHLTESITILDIVYEQDRKLNKREVESLLEKSKYLDTSPIIKSSERKRSLLALYLKELRPLDKGDTEKDESLLYNLLSELESEMYNDGKASLSHEQIKIVVPYQDAHRFAYNYLYGEVQTLPESHPQLFKYAPSMQDVLIATYLSGKIEGQGLIRELSKKKYFKKTKKGTWQIVKSILLPLGSTLAAINPTTSLIFLATTITLDTHQNIKNQRKEAANETHLIPSL